MDPPNARRIIEDERGRQWSAQESDLFLTAVLDASAKVDAITINGRPPEHNGGPDLKAAAVGG